MNRQISRGVVVVLSLGFVVLSACTKKEEAPAPPEGGSKETTMKSAADAAKGTEPPPAVPKDSGAAPASKLAELADVAKETFTVEKLKSMASSLSTDDLKGVADALVAAIQGQSGSLDKLKEQLAKLSPTDLGGMAEMKKSLSGAEALLKDLRGKLTVAVDGLKAKGVDVSKYTGFLTGK